MVKVKRILKVIAIFIGCFLMQACATNEELFAEYDDKFCTVPEHPGQSFRWEPVVYFDSDSATLSADAKSRLKTNAKTLGQLSGYKISLKGYTDHQASDAYNQSLSAKRARAVKKLLAVELGINPNRVISSAHGESSPLTNELLSPVREDRRVEMLLLDSTLTPVVNQPLIRAAAR